MNTESGLSRSCSESSICPHSVSSTADLCCTLHEWLVSTLRGGTDSYANAAFSMLRAHAAGKTISHNGLRADLGDAAASASHASICLKRSGPLLPLASGSRCCGAARQSRHSPPLQISNERNSQSADRTDLQNGRFISACPRIRPTTVVIKGP